MERDTIKSAKETAEETLSFEELAVRQGVRPVVDFDDLLGHPAAEDESVEEFAAMLREWRREGTHHSHRR
ncbi:hypothetical protein SBA3_3150007 [Candidatus Sulfopaludibacter sp. SbA3]|nr:hypothetical protein SBA3_3150007 [Candidatus Sulfopaludibacter sp. SbA3]